MLPRSSIISLLGPALKAPLAVALILRRDSMPAVRVHDLAAEPAMRLRADRDQSIGKRQLAHRRRNRRNDQIVPNDQDMKLIDSRAVDIGHLRFGHSRIFLESIRPPLFRCSADRQHQPAFHRASPQSPACGPRFRSLPHCARVPQPLDDLWRQALFIRSRHSAAIDDETADPPRPPAAIGQNRARAQSPAAPA